MSKDRSGKPPCPRCQSDQSDIVDSDSSTQGIPDGAYARRRKCAHCGHRWTTVEINLSFVGRTPYLGVHMH